MADKLARMAVELNVDADGLDQGLNKATVGLDAFENSLTGLNTQALDAMLSGLESQFNGMESQLAMLDARIEQTQNKMKAGGALGSTINADPAIVEMQSGASELQASLDLVAAKIDKVKGAINTIESSPITKLKDAFAAVGDKASESGNKSDFSMKKSMKTITRVGALLLGLRTIYSLITRAAQAYIGQNPVLQAQIDSMFVAFGSLLAPAIETVVKWMTQLVQWAIVAVAYMTTFVNVIFGLNIPITKAAKSTGNLNKTLKQTAKELSNLAGFDDLTILQSPTESGAADVTAPTIDMKPYDMTEQLKGLNKFAQDLKALQPIITPLVIILGILALAIIAVNIAMSLNPITLIIYAIAAVIAIVLLLIVYWKDISNAVILFVGIAWMWIQSFASNIGLAFNGIVDAISGAFNSAGKWIQAFVNNIGAAFNSVVTSIQMALFNAFLFIQTIVGNIGKAFGAAGNVIWSSLTSAFDNVKNTISNVWNWILNLFSSGGKIFSGVVDGVSNVFKTIVNALISGINVLIAVPFKAINGLLNAIRSINIMGFQPFVGMWSYNPLSIPQIPKLATGGVSSSPTIAQIGEGRYNEAVIPLGQSPQFAEMKRDIADMVLSGMNSNNNGGNAEVVLVIDGDVFGRVAIKNINKVQRQAGRTLIKM